VTGVREHWWWRPGWQPGRRFYTFHFTFEQQPAVPRLAAEARERLACFAALDPVPGRWLHLTTQGIGFSDEVSDGDLLAITAAARGRLAVVRAAEVTVSAPHAASEGAASRVGPAGSLNPAREALRAAIADVWGADKVPEPRNGPRTSPTLTPTPMPTADSMTLRSAASPRCRLPCRQSN
jgi:hypothetical protein